MSEKPKQFWKLKRVWVPTVMAACVLVGALVWCHVQAQAIKCTIGFGGSESLDHLDCDGVARRTGNYYTLPPSDGLVGDLPTPDPAGDYAEYRCGKGRTWYITRPFDPLGWLLDLFR
jgi:hypothetical protein